jgi:glucuronate isomerase
MKEFMSDDFLLESESAKKLFAVADKEPIFDYHCHLSPEEIYRDEPFGDIAALWLGGDHYKWRAMRSCGIDEKYITGESSGYEKFKAWAEAMPWCVGSPLYHWTHLELRRFFGIKEPLTPKTADAIWKKANSIIASGGFTPKQIIKSSNVAALCTTDDPADSLEYHKLIAQDKSFGVSVTPAFRPDKAMNIDAPGFAKYISHLADAAGMKIETLAQLRQALTKRLEYFSSLGCVASDHGITYMPYLPASDDEVDAIFKRALAGGSITAQDAEKFRTAVLTHLGSEYSRLHVVMEMHIGALRNNNTGMFNKLGPDTGYDSIADGNLAVPLSRFLDSLEQRGCLPKTILFCHNPSDNYIMLSLAGCFQVPGGRGQDTVRLGVVDE